MMLINGFLCEVVGLESILNELSHNIALYGVPDPVAPWGWQLFGHHAALNCLVLEGRMVLSPVFLGAEPNEIDEGPHAGAPSFTTRIATATDLMAALTPEQRATATSTSRWSTPAMPPGRVRDLALLDRRAPARRRLLPAHPVPGGHRRARPPPWSAPRLRHPQPFHIHTVVRTPHGNDYGRAWVHPWQQQHRRATSSTGGPRADRRRRG